LNVSSSFNWLTRTNLDYGSYYNSWAAGGQDVNGMHKRDDRRYHARREYCYQPVTQPLVTNDSEKAYRRYEQRQIGQDIS
jgi:hypothetical protein